MRTAWGKVCVALAISNSQARKGFALGHFTSLWALQQSHSPDYQTFFTLYPVNQGTKSPVALTSILQGSACTASCLGHRLSWFFSLTSLLSSCMSRFSRIRSDHEAMTPVAAQGVHTERKRCTSQQLPLSPCSISFAMSPSCKKALTRCQCCVIGLPSNQNHEANRLPCFTNYLGY